MLLSCLNVLSNQVGLNKIFKILQGLVSFNLWLQTNLQKAELTINRLRRLFGCQKTEKKRDSADEVDDSAKTSAPTPDDNTSATDEDGTVSNNKAPSESNETEPKKQRKKPVFDETKNHGRYGFDDYEGCSCDFIPHEYLKAGSVCPVCAEAKQSGRLTRIKPQRFVFLTGTPPITGERYECERLRCALCDTVFTEELSHHLMQRPKYDDRCYAILALLHYGYGFPFKRLEALQQYCQIPLPDATQWQKVNELYQLIKPLVHEVLIPLAAEGNVLQYDDTSNRILSQAHDYQRGVVKRKKVETTALISHYDNKVIVLFFTGGFHAIENVLPLLENRESDEPFFTMSDAHINNLPARIESELCAKWILCFCLIHARRYFYELIDVFPIPCQFVLKQIALVYQHEAHCKKAGYSAEARLEYHKKHSEPVMMGLHQWLTNQWQYHQTEENNALGGAIKYMLRHFEPLTQFLRVPGAPIDNNYTERIIKVVLRYRKASLFYKTQHGADVGDAFMSLIQTAIENKVNPFHYLTALKQHADEFALTPSDWLPWNYQASLQRCLQEAA